MAKVYPYVGTNKVSVTFLKRLQENRHLRGAGRLFFCIRRFVGSKYHPDNANEKEILLRFFKNTNQINRFLKILRDAGFVRRDKNGCYYLTSTDKIYPNSPFGKREYYVAIDKDGKGYIAVKDQKVGFKERTSKRKYVHVRVPDEVLLDPFSWNSWIGGVYVLSHARGLRFGETKKRSASFSATDDTSGLVMHNGQYSNPKTVADSSLVQGAATTLLSQKIGCHKSTASRMRKRGEIVGYKSYRYFKPTGFKVDRATRLILSRFDAPDPETGMKIDSSRIVFVAGEYMIEQPSLIVMNDNIFFLS